MSTQIDQRPAERRPEPEERRPVAGVVVVLVVLAVAALSVGYLTRGRGTGEGRAIAPAPASEARGEAAPVVTAPVAPPDWLSIVQSINFIAADLRAHPDPSKLYLYMDPANAAYHDAAEAQAKLAAGTWRYDPVPAPPRISAVSVLAADATTATLNVTFERTPRYRVLDASGAVVSDSAAGAGVARWKLRLDGQTWRIVEAVAL